MFRVCCSFRCLNKKIPIKSSRSLSLSSPVQDPRAPTYSSTGNVEKIVSKLGLSRISTMIMSGKPNRPLPLSDNHVDLEEFLPGAISAAGVVTSCVASNNWEQLEGLVEYTCIAGLQAATENISGEERDLIRLNQGDVFFSFVSNPENCDNGNNLHVVTFSLPKLERIKEMIQENKNFAHELEKNIKVEMENTEDKSKIKDTIQELMNDIKTKIDENNPHNIFSQNEILIGNFRFERKDPSSQWTVTEVSQINSLQAWPAIFKLRWKGRLGIAVKGSIDFYKVLRYDYMTDYVAFMIILTIYISMMGSPHG